MSPRVIALNCRFKRKLLSLASIEFSIENLSYSLEGWDGTSSTTNRFLSLKTERLMHFKMIPRESDVNTLMWERTGCWVHNFHVCLAFQEHDTVQLWMPSGLINFSAAQACRSGQLTALSWARHHLEFQYKCTFKFSEWKIPFSAWANLFFRFAFIPTFPDDVWASWTSLRLSTRSRKT